MGIKLLLLIFVASFLIKTDLSFDQDLGRHLKLGEIITQTNSVPKINLFSYTHSDFPFINTHYLFEWLIFWANQLIGLQGLLLLKIAIVLLAIWLTLQIIPKQHYPILLPVGFIMLHVLRERTDLRPEIFSFLFTTLTYFLLTKFEATSRLLWLLPLPIIQLLWVNSHIYFPLGLVLQGIFLLQITYHYLRSHSSSGKLKLLIFIFMLSTLASLANPHGLTGFLYPLNVTKNYGYTIVENQSMFLLESINFHNPNFLFVKLSATIIALSIVTSWIRKNPSFKSIALSLLGIGLAILHVRSFPYIALISLPATLANFGPMTWTYTYKWMSWGAGGFLILESLLYLNGSYYKHNDSQYQISLKFVSHGERALNFVKEHQLPGPIFNNFDIGSYIIYRAYPRLQVFVDGRPEAFPVQFFTQTYIPIQYDHEKFKQLDQQAGFQTIIFSHTDQTPWGKAFLREVVKDQDWKLVFIDDFMVVLIKNTLAQEKNLTAINLNQLDANNLEFETHASYLRLAIFLMNTGFAELALQFTQKALRMFPDSPLGNNIMASLTPYPISETYRIKAKNPYFW